MIPPDARFDGDTLMYGAWVPLSLSRPHDGARIVLGRHVEHQDPLPPEHPLRHIYEGVRSLRWVESEPMTWPCEAGAWVYWREVG